MSTHKYHAKPTVVDGIRFASRKESRRYGDLKLLERAGMISKLELQPRYHLDVNGKPVCTYVGDFEYVEHGKRICEDVKGFRTPEYKVKRNLFVALHPEIEHREI